MPSRSKSLNWIVPVIVVAAIAVLAGASLIDRGGESRIADRPVSSDTAAGTPATDATSAPNAPATTMVDEWPARRIDGDAYAMGDLDAPLVLVEYADFQCSFCARWHNETFPKIKDRYIDTGLVRLEWRDLPFLGEESFVAAYASRAAGQQGKFWEFFDRAYTVQGKTNTGVFDDEGVIQIATDIGLDIERFNADRADETLRREVHENLDEANGIGFTSTPSFVVNKRAIVGAQPYDVFVDALDASLEAIGVTPPE